MLTSSKNSDAFRPAPPDVSRSGRYFPALIIEEKDRAGGRNAALREAAARLCAAPRGETPCFACSQCRKIMDGAHPDVSVLDLGPGKEITVDKVRAMRSDAFIKPFEAERKVYAVLWAENLNNHAQNALLKLLEEPPSYAVFLLCASSAASLLPTIRSRCVTVRSFREARDEESAEAGERGRKLYEAIVKGDELALVKVLWSWDKLPRIELRAALRMFCLTVRERLGLDFPEPRAAKALDETLIILDALDGNASVGICCAALCAKLAVI